jgi:hypothetical protein
LASVNTNANARHNSQQSTFGASFPSPSSLETLENLRQASFTIELDEDVSTTVHATVRKRHWANNSVDGAVSESMSLSNNKSLSATLMPPPKPLHGHTAAAAAAAATTT